MTERTFARWVEPIAAACRESRGRVVEFARSQPEAAWDRPSPLEGWTCKDLLAHIGKANDMMFQEILRTISAGKPLDRSVFAVDTDGDNNRKVDERRSWPAAKVIEEVEVAGEEMQDLLAQLADGHEHYKQDDPPFILSGFLDLVEREDHDSEHLAQLRAALEAKA